MDAAASTLATLLVSCPDRRGIVAALAQVLYGHGANILDSDQHTDSEASLFFQRLRFDLSELMTDRVALERAIAELAERFQMQYRLVYQAKRKRVAIFVSKYDHCLYDLLLRQRAGELSGDIVAVQQPYGFGRRRRSVRGAVSHVPEERRNEARPGAARA